MRNILLIAFALSLSTQARAIEVPPFTPNVVDTAKILDAAEVQEINRELDKIRGEAQILSAVYLLDTLEVDSIEAVAEKAFNTWGLGAKGQDTGLLLVLAMGDRQSRFEVGYGLEGDLPDVVAKRALDDVMKPILRDGRTKDAILEGFRYLAAVRMKNPDAEKFVENAGVPAWTSTGELHWRRGLISLVIYLFAIWLIAPVIRLWSRALAKKLEPRMPEYRYSEDKDLQAPLLSQGGIGLRLFFSLNPGVFIFIGAGFVFWLALILPAAILLIAWSYFRNTVSKYRSPEAYNAFIVKARRENADMVAKGYKKEISPGIFEHTPAWYSSAEYRAQKSRSSSSSSSSSSSRSSSGGGRSGGGGASSSW